jgi:Flp pilus assembly protein TadG
VRNALESCASAMDGKPEQGAQPRKVNFCSRRGFRRADKGSVAVEFALTAIPFFTLLFAILEAGLVFFANATLDGAVNDAARLIRTGQARDAAMTSAQMTQTICDRVALLPNCTTSLKLDVRTFTSFSNVTFPQMLDQNGNLTQSLKFQIGDAGDIVLVRAFYVWSIKSPMAIGLNNLSGSSRLITSSAAFRNEPFNL